MYKKRLYQKFRYSRFLFYGIFLKLFLKNCFIIRFGVKYKKIIIGGVSVSEKLKIVIPDKKTVSNGDLDFRCFQYFGDVVEYDISGEELLAERIKDADIILCNKTPMNEKTLASAENLKYIGLFATGYNNVDLDYTSRRNITVCNSPEYSTDAVAQHTFALILDHCSRVSEYNDFVQRGEWIRADVFSPFVYQMRELSGKTLGIVGFGSIGRAVAKTALAFNMNVLVYSRTRKDTSEGIAQVDLNTLVSESDFVTVHCPLNKESERMFDRELFSRFKKGAFFVNTARGGVVDESALKEALENGTLSGAAVDVLDTEPMSESCSLLGVRNLTITPHVAWAPTETRERLITVAYNNLKSYLDGKPRNVIC